MRAITRTDERDSRNEILSMIILDNFVLKRTAFLVSS